MAGKGSSPRPFSVDKKTYDSNWDKIFSKKQQNEEKSLDQELFGPVTEDKDKQE